MGAGDGVRIIVCGGRNYGNTVDETANVHFTLLALHTATPLTAIIQGGARGADECAREWAKEYGIKSVTVPANWATHGKAAGPIRNQRMIEDFKPDLVVSFPGGRGTADLVRRAQAAGIRIFRA